MTLSDAANYLGVIPKGDVAFGGGPLISAGFEAAAAHIGKKPQEVARAMIHECRDRIIAAVRGLAKDYHVSPEDLRIVAGGGGAGVIAGEVAASLKTGFEIAPYPAVISAVGGAAAVSTFSHEVFCPEPSKDDFAKLRGEAILRLGEAGVPPDQAKVTFEFDSAQKLLRVEAEGTIGFETFGERLGESELAMRAAELSGADEDSTEYIYSEGLTAAISCRRSPRRRFGRAKESLVCLDRFGRSLLVVSGAEFRKSADGKLHQNIDLAISEYTVYGDGGETAPEMFILTPMELLDFSTFVSKQQVEAALAVMKDRTTGKCLLIVRRRA